MDNFENGVFFYDRNFNKQDDVAIAGNCVQQLIAIVMKEKVKVSYDPYSVYMNDISFGISCDKEGYLSRSAIKSNEIIDDFCIAVIHREIAWQNYLLAKKMITEALDIEGYAVLRTVDAFLPFSIYRDENFDLSNFFENGHYFMIIAEDDMNYYYVDQLSELDESGYQHILSRKDIGVCPKEDFRKSLSCYAKVITFKFDIKCIAKACTHAIDILSKSVDHFYKEISLRKSDDDNILIYGGNAALKYMLKASEEGKFILNKKVYNTSLKGYCNIDIAKELMNGATGQRNRRMLLKGFFENSDFSNKEQLVEAADIAKDAWEMLKNQVLKKYLRNDFQMHDRDRQYIENIVNAEGRLFDLMRVGIS